MLNEDLLTDIDKLKYRIHVLEKQIEAFKEYDQKRKEYYKRIVQNYGAMEAYIAELEDGDASLKKIKELKSTVTTLNNIIMVNRMRTKISDEEVEKLVRANTIKALNKKISEQKEVIKRLTEDQKKLIYRIVKLEGGNSTKNETDTSENE